MSKGVNRYLQSWGAGTIIKEVKTDIPIPKDAEKPIDRRTTHGKIS